MFVRLALLLAIVGVVLSPSQITAQDQPAWGLCSTEPEKDPSQELIEGNPLAGRLGSTLADWEAIYGEPDPEALPLFHKYVVEGCGTVMIELSQDELRIVGITVYAPRDENTGDMYNAQDADWDLAQAILIAASITPTDTNLGQQYEVPNPFGYIRIDCISEHMVVMGEGVHWEDWDYVDNNPDYGQFSVIMTLNTEGKILSVGAKLSLEDPISS